jgi:hypothetical protein
MPESALSPTSCCGSVVGAKEQVAERAPKQIGDPPLHQMVRAIVDHVAALAQALEIALPVLPGL